MMRRNIYLVVCFLVCFQVAVASEVAFWAQIADEDYYINYAVENGSVSPVVVSKVTNEGSLYVSFAYHPVEKVFYIYAFGERLGKAKKGMYLTDGRCLEVLDPEFELTEAEAAFSPEEPDELVRGILGLLNAKNCLE